LASHETHIVFFADTHLGFDDPVRPRVERRRRGPDFSLNFQRVLDHARERHASLVIHGGDLFFRSRVPPAIVDRTYRRLTEFADSGIPIAIVPGNHERSALPSSLFLAHPGVHVFARPAVKRFELAGARVAVAGLPCERRDARRRLPPLLRELGQEVQRSAPSELRLLCLHQAIEGARAGDPAYIFRYGDDVLRMEDLPPCFDAVLAGHIHRRQILVRRRPDGSSMPVVYAGSTERTSLAERLEPKGFFDLRVGPARNPSPAAAGPTNGPVDRAGALTRPLLRFAFVELPTRPMEAIAR